MWQETPSRREVPFMNERLTGVPPKYPIVCSALLPQKATASVFAWMLCFINSVSWGGHTQEGSFPSKQKQVGVFCCVFFPLFSAPDWTVTSHHMPSSKHSSPDKSCDPFCLFRSACPAGASNPDPGL